MSGCSGREAEPSADAPAQTFIGEVQGTDAVIAIVEDAKSWTAYVCGGPTTYATLTRWFGGASEGRVGSGTLHGSAAGASLVADRVASARQGKITSGDVEFAFHAAPVAAPVSSVTGLFSAVHAGCRAGLVVMPTGTEDPPRTQGVWCDQWGRFGQVTPIVPITLEGDQVAVHVGEPAQELFMQPVAPALELDPVP